MSLADDAAVKKKVVIPWLVVYNFISLEIGWLICVAGPQWGAWWAGPAMVVLLLIPHALLMKPARSEWVLLAGVGVLGFTLDTALGLAGILVYEPVGAAVTWLCPLWLAALWVNFATSLNHCLGWLKGRPWLAAGFGAVGGPVAYYTGTRFDAISFGTGAWTAIAVLAVVWGLLIPALYVLNGWLQQKLDVQANRG